MGPQQAGNNLMDELAAKQDAIVHNLGWDELGDKERIERLREFTKEAINNYAEHYTQILNGLSKRVEQLERHRHDANGRAMIEHHLDTGRGVQDMMTQPTMSSQGAYALTPKLVPGTNSKYI